MKLYVSKRIKTFESKFSISRKLWVIQRYICTLFGAPYRLNHGVSVHGHAYQHCPNRVIEYPCGVGTPGCQGLPLYTYSSHHNILSRISRRDDLDHVIVQCPSCFCSYTKTLHTHKIQSNTVIVSHSNKSLPQQKWISVYILTMHYIHYTLVSKLVSRSQFYILDKIYNWWNLRIYVISVFFKSFKIYFVFIDDENNSGFVEISFFDFWIKEKKPIEV